MSDVVDQIAAVIRKHDIDVYLNDDDTSGSMCLGCDWIRQDATGTECAAHVAEQIEAELQLTEETDNIIDRHWTDSNTRIIGTKRRWVSAWSAAEGNP